MFLPRIIPVLLLKDLGLVKTVKFKNPRYIGDPINAVKIFNDLKADELVFLDIQASKQNRSISLEIVKEISDEAFMPFAVGGGINNIKTVEDILKNGAEKVVLNSAIINNFDLIRQIANHFGSQSIIISIDVKKNFFNKNSVWIKSNTVNTKLDPVELAMRVQDLGAGEILINSIDRDGCMCGYDLELLKSINKSVSIPVIACGGAGNLQHLKDGYDAGAHSLAAGSLFIYHSERRAVLVNYPSKPEVIKIFQNME